MALAFAVGSACFVVGPFPGYVNLVGETAAATTFFVGSIFFTAGGALQTVSAWGRRRAASGGKAAFWSAAVQSAGTLFFNASTFRALDTALSNPQYDRLVWRPDALGSVCFLISGALAYWAVPRHGWQPAVNLLGCVFFAIAAIAGYLVPSRGSILDLAAANWNTCLGALCFFACAVATLARRREEQPA